MNEEIIQKLPGIKENEPLAPYTTFKIGGPARYFFVARSAEDVRHAVNVAKEFGMPFFILGGGSNILVSDQGFNGLVIQNQIKGFNNAREESTYAIVTAGAGENWDSVVAQCVAKGWQGIECLSGIPGTVGAAPVQNIGAYGQSVDATIYEISAVDSESSTLVTFNNAQCEFSYRDSIFKRNPGRYIIAEVTFMLSKIGTPLVAYHDLKQYFGEKKPTLQEVRQAVIEIRARKGYVIMPGYECYKTAGSFFMNPIIPKAQFEKLQKMITGCPDPWFWLLPDGRVKVSSACLLQSAGFTKGYRKGNVGISPKHSLSLVNFGGALAQELVALSQTIKKTVQEKAGVAIKEEVGFVGF